MTNVNSLVLATATVTDDAADRLVAAAFSAAAEAEVNVSVGVVDAGGNLKAFRRSDGAPFLTVDAAIDKAWTAASFGYPTHVWNAYIADPKLAPLGNTARMLAVGGGYPLMMGGQLVGGMGVSGGTYEEDQQVALAALTAVGFEVG